MLISKFDLYKSEWLELVFANRNKSYGAYELRQHNGRTTASAMAIGFSFIFAAAAAVFIFQKPVEVVPQKVAITPVVLHPYILPQAVPPKPITHIRQPIAPPVAPAVPHIYVPFVVSNTPLITEPPKITELSGPISSTPANGPATAPIDQGGGISPGTTSPGDEGTEVHPLNGLQQMPEPYGGAAGWAKFLQKNLKYPDAAIQEDAQGKVWVSFIVEKDGHLSDILVNSGAGYGMDEEAIRVLKLAPAWKPGIQNGQAVRVRYNIPINFILGYH